MPGREKILLLNFLRNPRHVVGVFVVLILCTLLSIAVLYVRHVRLLFLLAVHVMFGVDRLTDGIDHIGVFQ